MTISTITIVTLLICAAYSKDHKPLQTQYDFIVVGAGTSGLVVAKRLAELKNTSVAVIEAGDSVLNNRNVSNVDGYGLAFGTNIDWAYQTTNQTYAGGSTQTMRAGKAIGGTSTINGRFARRDVSKGFSIRIYC